MLRYINYCCTFVEHKSPMITLVMTEFYALIFKQRALFNEQRSCFCGVNSGITPPRKRQIYRVIRLFTQTYFALVCPFRCGHIKCASTF